MLVVPNQSFAIAGNGQGSIVVDDIKNVNAKPGLGLALKQLFFCISVNISSSVTLGYDAYITVNGEPVALLAGEVGSYFINATSGDAFAIAPSQFVITYDPAVPIAQKDTIEFQAILTAKFGLTWVSNVYHWSYMLNFA